MSDDGKWDRQLAEFARRGRASVQDMTLGTAVDMLRVPPFACACYSLEFCCKYRWEQAAALHRVAHIAVKLIADKLIADTRPSDVEQQLHYE